MNYKDLKILFEDNHVLVVVKPPNIPVQADISGDEDMLTMLKAYLVEKYDKPGDAYLGLVHRLDRPTGGVMVFAKTSKAASRLSEGIREGDFDKKYFAICQGSPKVKQQKLVNYLKKIEVTNTVKIVPPLTEGAKMAELMYKTLDEKEDMSLLAVTLTTGRGHQIRVQLSAMGNSIVGDYRYGFDGPQKLPLCLWATELRFTHPVSAQRMMFRVYPPEDIYPWSVFDLDRFLRITVKNE